jgi:hypothetical protein
MNEYCIKQLKIIIPHQFDGKMITITCVSCKAYLLSQTAYEEACKMYDKTVTLLKYAPEEKKEKLIMALKLCEEIKLSTEELRDKASIKIRKEII